jgi:hypothetical protein
MKELFGEKLELNIYTTDSEQAQKYNFRSSTNVMLDQELIPLEVSTDKSKMKDFLSKKIAG